MVSQPKPDEVDWEFRDRDIKILSELARDPQLTSRELADILTEEHGIDVSHVTVNKSIRQMREEEVFREAILPNERYYNFALFEFKFNPEHFDEHWRDAMKYIKESEHTMMFFIADGEYQWKSIMMFRSRLAESRWIHDFYKEHGRVVENVRNSVAHNILKYRTDPEIFEQLTR